MPAAFYCMLGEYPHTGYKFCILLEDFSRGFCEVKSSFLMFSRMVSLPTGISRLFSTGSSFECPSGQAINHLDNTCSVRASFYGRSAALRAGGLIWKVMMADRLRCFAGNLVSPGSPSSSSAIIGTVFKTVLQVFLLQLVFEILLSFHHR